MGTVTGTSSNATPTSYILFTAYSITSAYTLNGLCVTTSGSSISLSPAFSITIPATVDSTAYSSSVGSLFEDHLGFSTCEGNGMQASIVSLTPLVEVGIGTSSPFATLLQVANATSSPLSTNVPTTSPSSAPHNSSSSPTIISSAENISPGFSTRDKAATGVVVPVVAIISFILGVIYLRSRRRRFQNRSHSGNGLADPSEEAQPYLQQKAELEAEEKRRLELEAVEVRYEMDGGNDRNNLLAPGEGVRNEIDTIARPPMPSLRERQELRGEECSKELEAP